MSQNGYVYVPRKLKSQFIQSTNHISIVHLLHNGRLRLGLSLVLHYCGFRGLWSLCASDHWFHHGPLLLCDLANKIKENIINKVMKTPHCKYLIDWVKKKANHLLQIVELASHGDIFTTIHSNDLRTEGLLKLEICLSLWKTYWLPCQGSSTL